MSDSSFFFECTTEKISSRIASVNQNSFSIKKGLLIRVYKYYFD